MLQGQHRKYQKSPLQSDDLGHYIGHGLLTSNGDYWLKQRRLIQPAFYKNKLESVKQIVVDTITDELECFENGKTHEVLPIMSDLAFKVVGKSLFSYSDDGKSMHRLQEITSKLQEDVIKEIRQPYKYWWLKLSGKIKKTEALAQESRDLLKKIITERKNSKKTYNDLLDMLLSSEYEDGSKMEMNQLIDEILILFTAGHETTASALVFTLILLTQHPEIQTKLYEEVKDINAGEFSMMEFFMKVPYTKQCIDESMRLYPPAYFSDRIAIEDDNFGDLDIKKGTTILISFFEVHRNSKFWKDAEKFNPERFNSISKKELSDWYYPFGTGPRMCVGSNLAMYEMMVVIVEVVKKYHICLLYTSPSPRDKRQSRMPSSA